MHLSLGERNPALLGTTLDDVRRTLSLLETAGVITAMNGDGYVSDTSPEGARQLIASLAVRIEEEGDVARGAALTVSALSWVQ